MRSSYINIWNEIWTTSLVLQISLLISLLLVFLTVKLILLSIPKSPLFSKFLFSSIKMMKIHYTSFSFSFSFSNTLYFLDWIFHASNILSHLKSIFVILSLGLVHLFLGTDLKPHHEGIVLSQEKYIQALLHKSQHEEQEAHSQPLSS